MDIESILQPWYESLEDPEESQRKTLETLVAGYKKTAYGQQYGATTVDDFRNAFPVITFPALVPFIDTIKKGEWQTLLPEPPVEWGMTRGSTGVSKIVPFTKTDMEQKGVCGSRGTLNYVYNHKRYDILEGYALNNNFPAKVGTMTVGDTTVDYGYSTGIYAKYAYKGGKIKFIPTPKQINQLGAGTTKKDWEKRFDFTYKEAKDKNVTMVTGAVQGMIHFGAFLKKKYDIYPKNVWESPLLVCASLPGIHTKEKPVLKGMYDFLDVREMYGATEGIYAQQLDERPYVFPNYDYYFFEVETKSGIKMLYELEKGERGSLIVSSCLFPRYKIGDVIKSFGGSAFMCLGREKDFNVVTYYWNRLMGQTL
jgi:hypothetical protein